MIGGVCQVDPATLAERRPRAARPGRRLGANRCPGWSVRSSARRRRRAAGAGDLPRFLAALRRRHAGEAARERGLSFRGRGRRRAARRHCASDPRLAGAHPRQPRRQRAQARGGRHRAAGGRRATGAGSSSASGRGAGLPGRRRGRQRSDPARAGLGLHIVDALAERLGGEIELRQPARAAAPRRCAPASRGGRRTSRRRQAAGRTCGDCACCSPRTTDQPDGRHRRCCAR